VSVRLYRALIKAYPAAFCRQYGDEMTLVFRELATDAWSRRGWFGLACMWCRVLADLAGSVLRQHWLADNPRVLVRSTARMDYKSFRISIGGSNPDVRWTAWRIAAVVLASLVTLFAGIVGNRFVFTLWFDYSYRLANPAAPAQDMLTAIVIGNVIGLIANVFIVWIGARLIQRFAARPPRRPTPAALR
jgi:hypothetical protein